MRITRKRLKEIIREEKYLLLKEMHPRAAMDDAYVAELEEKEDELATQIRHASKDIYGTKDHYDLRGKSVEELEDILYDLANSPEQKYLDDEARIEMEDEMGYDSELSRAEMAPRRQGMSRRPSGSKSQRRMEIKSRISKVIKEQMEQMGLEEPIFLDFTPPADEPKIMGQGGNSKMAKSQLFHIAKNSQSLHDKLNDKDELPNWAQSKIAVAKSLMDAVYDHLDYKMQKGDYE